MLLSTSASTGAGAALRRLCPTSRPRRCSRCTAALVVGSGAAAVLFAIGIYHAPARSADVVCSTVNVGTLTAILPRYRAVRLCWPAAKASSTTLGANQRWPLHVFAHGDFAGAFLASGYFALQERIAAQGFAVAMYLSCAFSPLQCEGGRSSFFEVLNVFTHLEARRGWWDDVIDPSRPWSASGHSTGGRAVLMIAALKDEPRYLEGTGLAPRITPAHWAALGKLGAVAATHPDEMMLSLAVNPDVGRWKGAIRSTAVMVITGTADWVEPPGSAWRAFEAVASTDKLFVNLQNATHMTPQRDASEGCFIGAFAQRFALGNLSAEPLLYGDGPGSLVAELPVARGEGPNQGAGNLGMVACLAHGRAAGSPMLIGGRASDKCTPGVCGAGGRRWCE